MKKNNVLFFFIISVTACFSQDTLDPTGYYTSRRKLRINNGAADKELNSRTFFKNLDFYNSTSRYPAQKYYKNTVAVALPVDERDKYLGEPVAAKIKVEHYVDFWSKPTMQAIQIKIINDLTNYNTPIVEVSNSDSNSLVIVPKVEVFFICVRGAPLWRRSYAKVRLQITATQKHQELLNQKYESVYDTNGNDEDWEGIDNESIESGANVAIGICLRQALDKFYKDLDTKLNTTN